MAHTDAPAPNATAAENIAYVQPLTPGRVMVLTLSVLFVIGVVWFVIQIRHVVLLVIVGILIATAIEPGVNALRRRGISRGPVILASYLLFFGVIVGGMLVALPPLFDQGRELVTRAPELLADLQQRVANSPSELVRTYGSRVMDGAIGFYDQLREDPPIQAVQVVQAAQFVTSFFGLLFAVVSIMIVTFYWMTEKAVIKRFFLGLVPIERRDRAHNMWDEIESKAGGWARGQL
nr:AI-2E family transporter [Chloroflexia bacterium]